jgi:hypothetical protein
LDEDPLFMVSAFGGKAQKDRGIGIGLEVAWKVVVRATHP